MEEKVVPALYIGDGSENKQWIRNARSIRVGIPQLRQPRVNEGAFNFCVNTAISQQALKLIFEIGVLGVQMSCPLE